MKQVAFYTFIFLYGYCSFATDKKVLQGHFDHTLQLSMQQTSHYGHGPELVNVKEWLEKFFVREDVRPLKTFRKLLHSLRKVSPNSGPLAKLVKALDIIDDTVLFDVDDDYLGGDVQERNQGLINYFSKKLCEDEKFLHNAQDFYGTVKEWEGKLRLYHAPSLWDRSLVDFWPLAQEKTNNKFEALSLMTLFGHDDCCQEVTSRYCPSEAMKKSFQNLDLVRPLPFGSIYYYPGALDNEVPSKALREHFSVLLLRYNLLFPDDNAPRYHKWFNARNYHFIAGAFLASQMIRQRVHLIAGLPTLITIA